MGNIPSVVRLAIKRAHAIEHSKTMVHEQRLRHGFRELVDAAMEWVEAEDRETVG